MFATVIGMLGSGLFWALAITLFLAIRWWHGDRQRRRRSQRPFFWGRQ